MSLHKSGAQKRKEKKRADSERRGLQTLFQVGMRKKTTMWKSIGYKR